MVINEGMAIECVMLRHDFKARLLSNGRFTTQDPKRETYYPISPYTYCADNPIKYVDWNGRDVLNFISPREDPELYEYASNYKDDNAIHIFAHGNRNGVSLYKNSPNEIRIKDAKSFESYVLNKSKIWLKSKQDNARTTIILHSCKTGGAGAFAEKLSNDKSFNNTTIVAPTNLILYNKKTKTAEVRSRMDKNGRIVYGRWLFYRKGKIIRSFDSKWIPKENPSLLDYIIHH